MPRDVLPDNAACDSLEYPSSAQQVPIDAEDLRQTLSEMSSVILDPALQTITGATGHWLAAGGVSGLILSGDATSVRQMFVFATVAASRPLDPKR